MHGTTYSAAVNVGDVMHTYAIAEVVNSRVGHVAGGDIVLTESGWADYSVVTGADLSPVPRPKTLSHLLSIQDIAGTTAYHCLLDIGQPATAETVVVSAPAASVRMYVGQIAKLKGCLAVGIAGGQEKCNWVVKVLGFDACIDYRSPNFFRELRAACPDGIDIYFDNVGGQVLESALFLMNMYARVVCCGAVSQYNKTSPSGPRNLPGLVVVKRLRMQGFIVMDFADQASRAEQDLSRWVAEQQIIVVEDIIDALEHPPAALIGLLAGDNRGKRMVRVAGDRM